jgi:hypothetical protein
LVGFVIRDFGGIKVHQQTLKNSCGAELEVLPDSCVIAKDPNEVSFRVFNMEGRKLSFGLTGLFPGVQVVIPHIDI